METISHKLIIYHNEKIENIFNTKGMRACRELVKILSINEKNKKRYTKYISGNDTLIITEKIGENFEYKHIFKGSICSEYIEYNY